MISIIGLFVEFMLLAGFRPVVGENIGDDIALLLIFAFTVLFAYDMQHNRRLGSLKGPLLLGYLFRVGLLLMDIFGRSIFVLPNASSDDEMFYWGAVRYARYGGWTRTNYPKVMGVLFRYIGTNRLYGQFISMLFAILALVLLAYALRELDISDSTKYRVFQVVCLLPNFAILSVLFMREALITMFMTASFYSFICWVKRKKERYYLYALLWVLPAAWFHSGVVAALIGYMAIRFIYDNRQGALHITATSVFLGFVLVMAAAFLFLNYGDAFLGKFAGVDSLEDIANTNDAGGSSYAQYVGNSSSPLSMAIYTLPRMIYFLFSPFPWQWRGISDLIAFFFSGLYYLIVIISAFRYLRDKNAPNHAVVFALLVLALVTAFVFGWGTSNTGTASRHRDKLITLFAMLWATSTDGQPLQWRITFSRLR